jgi:ATP-dependent RNA helicase DHX57
MANRDAPQDYGPLVLQAIASINEAPINYALLEAAIVHVVDVEAQDGPLALLKNWEGLHDTVDNGKDPLVGPGAILVFLPGSAEIAKLQKLLECSSALSHALRGTRAHVLPLHGGLPPAQQGAAFKSYGRMGRKIVLATNVAETSVTIPDVTVVIDTGRMKEMQYNGEKGLVRLVDTWVSKASAQQRRGRAGRVRCVDKHPQLINAIFCQYFHKYIDNFSGLGCNMWNE